MTVSSAEVTVTIQSMGRPSLKRTVAALPPSDALAEVVVLDTSPAGMDHETLARACPAPLRTIRARSSRGGRNVLIDAAGTDIVLFTDDDCVPAPGWVDELAAFMQSSPEVAAAFGYVAPAPLPGCEVVSTEIPGVGAVAWGEVAIDEQQYWCPAISDPSWTVGVVSCAPTVPWACAGSSNNLGLRRTLMPPGRPPFLPQLGPGTPAGAGEDTELGYALMAAGRAIAYVPRARVYHDSWLPREGAEARRRAYLRSNIEALGYHVLRGDRRAGELLSAYLDHFCHVNEISDLGEALEWAYGGRSAPR